MCGGDLVNGQTGTEVDCVIKNKIKSSRSFINYLLIYKKSQDTDSTIVPLVDGNEKFQNDA